MNVKGWLSRFLGYACQQQEPEYIKGMGLFAICDGELVMGFVAYLLRTREIKLASAVQAGYALQKASPPPRPQPGSSAAAPVAAL